MAAATKKKVAEVLVTQRAHVIEICKQIAVCVEENRLKEARGRLDRLILEFGVLEELKARKIKAK